MSVAMDDYMTMEREALIAFKQHTEGDDILFASTQDNFHVFKQGFMRGKELANEQAHNYHEENNEGPCPCAYCRNERSLYNE